jgi:hypothetical protein
VLSIRGIRTKVRPKEHDSTHRTIAETALTDVRSVTSRRDFHHCQLRHHKLQRSCRSMGSRDGRGSGAGCVERSTSPEVRQTKVPRGGRRRLTIGPAQSFAPRQRPDTKARHQPVTVGRTSQSAVASEFHPITEEIYALDWELP